MSSHPIYHTQTAEPSDKYMWCKHIRCMETMMLEYALNHSPRVMARVAVQVLTCGMGGVARGAGQILILL